MPSLPLERLDTPDAKGRQPGFEPRNRLHDGLDGIRLFAVCLVTAQHALTLVVLDNWTLFQSLNIGQFGVALFLGLSGILVGQSHRPPLPWLLQRLRRLIPAYWVAICLSFLLTWAIGHKRFDAYQGRCPSFWSVN